MDMEGRITRLPGGIRFPGGWLMLKMLKQNGLTYEQFLAVKDPKGHAGQTPFGRVLRKTDGKAGDRVNQ